jgi:hypothetical protein
MYLTYNKSLPMFDQCMVQLESDKPEDSKVYVEFQEGFIPLAAKYYEALAAQEELIFGTLLVDKPTLAEGVKEELIEKPTVAEGVKEVIIDKPTVVVVEEVPVVDDVSLATVSVPAPVEPVVAPVIVEDVPVVDDVRLDPVSVPAPVVTPAQPVVDPAPIAKKARKTSV